MNKLDEIYNNQNDIKFFYKNYINYLYDILENVSLVEIESFLNILLSAREKGKRIYFIGNGGSAATSSHFANDLSIGVKTPDNMPFKAISLCDNHSIITAIANDYGYEDIFYRQLLNTIKKDDVLISISASGNSKNLIKAIHYANDIGAKTIGISAFTGGEMRKTVQYSLHVPTNIGEYGPAEDVHMIFDHLFSSFISRLINS